MVQRLVAFKIYALSVSLSFILLLSPIQLPLRLRILRFKVSSAGPFHSIPSALLRRGSAFGLTVDVGGVELTSKAGLFSCCNSCKAGHVVGAPRIACHGLCTAARYHTADENPGCLLGCSPHHNQCPTCCAPLLPSGLTPANVSLLRLSSTSCCSKLPFVVTGSAFSCLVYLLRRSSKLQRTHQGHGLNCSANLCMAELRW